MKLTNRGHGDCKFPVSSIESCTEESRLLLNYQACPDVYGSESTGFYNKYFQFLKFKQIFNSINF